MANPIPYAKQSKRRQRAQDRAKRKTWGAINPVTRKPPNPKTYNRRKAQRWDDPYVELFCCACRSVHPVNDLANAATLRLLPIGVDLALVLRAMGQAARPADAAAHAGHPLDEVARKRALGCTQ